MWVSFFFHFFFQCASPPRNASKTAQPIKWLLFGANLGIVFGMSASGYGLEMLEEAAVSAELTLSHRRGKQLQQQLLHPSYWMIQGRHGEAYCCRATAMQYARPDECVSLMTEKDLQGGKLKFIS